MKILLFALILCILTAVNLTAQNFASQRPSFGLFAGFNLNDHNADFKEISGFTNCCDKFTEGSGTGFSIGLFYRLPVVTSLTASLRAGLFDMSGTLERTELTTVSGAIPATVLHTMEGSLLHVGIEPLATYNLFGPFNILGGFRLSMPLSATFSQYETLQQPAGGTFENGRRIRNEAAGDIPNADELCFALVAGASADLPLVNMEEKGTGRFKGGLYLSPEITYSLGLRNIAATGLNWKVNILRIGLSVGYISGDEAPLVPEPPQEQPKKKDIVTLQIQPPPLPLPPTAVISAKGVEADGRETPAITIRVEEFLSTNVKPLLNYVFFDENSDVLPSRYKRLAPPETAGFSPDKLFGAGTLETYYDFLNIVGRRLRDNPTAKITLTGCNADNASEKGNTALSRRRAESVKSYLISAWNIAPERINLEARNLPEKPSNVAEPDGIVENRRVEITSDTRAILEPVIANDTFRQVTPPKLRFFPQASGERPITTWKIAAANDAAKTASFDGQGTPPQFYDWDIQHSADILSGTKALNYQLAVSDSMGFNASSNGKIAVEQISVQSKKENRVKDKIIDRYSLILFDFDKSDISGMNSFLVDFIRKRAGENAVITATGFTDRIGDADHNRRLSADRAKSAAKQLGTSDFSGKGEETLLYDNSLPEGRFYSRTVEIVVEKPVE